MGPQDQADRRLPALLPTRHPRLLGRRHQRHRRRRAGLAERRRGRRRRSATRCWPAARASTSCSPRSAPTPTASARRRPKNGRGLVLGNPHFPWDGSERLYQAHLQIPGKLDVAGGSLYGVPLVLIGHTKGLAWSHTVATAWRFTPFALTLAPGDPHSYIVDGQVKKMEATEGRGPARGRRHRRADDLLDRVRADDRRPRRHPAALDRGRRLRPARRQRDQLPLPQPLLRQRLRADGRGVRRDRAQVPGHPLGQLDRRRLQGRGLLLDAGRDPLRARRARRPLQRAAAGLRDARPPGPRRLRSSCNWADRRRRASPPAPSRPTRCRRSSATTTSTTATTSHWLTNPEAPLTGYRPHHRHRAR